MRHLYDRLEQLVAVAHVQVAGGGIWIPETPVEFEELADLVEPAEPAAAGDGNEDDDEPLSLYDQIEEAGQISTLLYLEWSLGAPIAWEYRLSLLNTGDASMYALHVPDPGTDDPVLVIARLQSEDHRAIVEAFVEELIAADGQPYVEQLFGSLPTEIRISRPDLLAPETIAAGLQRYASRAAEAWSDMATAVDRLERGEIISAHGSGDDSEERTVAESDHPALLQRYLDLVLRVEG